MNIYKPNYAVMRMFPEITALNLQPEYTLVYGYETPTTQQIVYDDPRLLSQISRYCIDFEKDIYLLTFKPTQADLTTDGLTQYGRAVSRLPYKYAKLALFCVEVKILYGEYPNELSYITIKLEEWISAISLKRKDFACVQERGDLVQGAYRDGDRVVLAFSTWGQDSPPYPDGVTGVRISADALLRQLKALQLKINFNDGLIHTVLKKPPSLWRAVTSIFRKTDVQSKP
jgi:hypothetical protein